jgi:hypothetical protein
MNVGGILLLFLVIVGAAFGLMLVVSKANMNAPVDSAGNTVSAADNATRNITLSSAPAVTTLVGWMVMVGAGMVLIIFLIYLALSGKSFKSRY